MVSIAHFTPSQVNPSDFASKAQEIACSPPLRAYSARIISEDSPYLERCFAYALFAPTCHF